MEPRDMSIFSSIMNKIFHHGSSSPTSAGGSGAQVASAAAPSTASGGTGAGGQTVDVEAVLSGMDKNAGQKLDWRHSIVDLMKLLNLDSSLSGEAFSPAGSKRSMTPRSLSITHISVRGSRASRPGRCR